MAADLLYKSMPGLCLIISRAARYLPKPALNNILSLCVYYNIYGFCPLIIWLSFGECPLDFLRLLLLHIFLLAGAAFEPTACTNAKCP